MIDWAASLQPVRDMTSCACSQGPAASRASFAQPARVPFGRLPVLPQATSQGRPLQPTDIVTIASNRRGSLDLPVGLRLARLSGRHRSDVAKLRRRDP